MARVKRGIVSRRKHSKVTSQAKGYYGRRKNVYRVAVQAVEKAGQYAYRDRRAKKRNFRSPPAKLAGGFCRLGTKRLSAALNAPSAVPAPQTHTTTHAPIAAANWSGGPHANPRARPDGLPSRTGPVNPVAIAAGKG